jgi:hypothetical protein
VTRDGSHGALASVVVAGVEQVAEDGDGEERRSGYRRLAQRSLHRRSQRRGEAR